MDGEQQAPCILIVDDHEDNVEVLRARLEASGYRTASALDGEEALRQVVASPPDLILLDVMMPKMDGHEVARRIKGNASLPFIPIIMQTALDSVEHKVEGLGAGADDYITKPINFKELEARVRSMLRIKALQEAVEKRERALEEANTELQRVAITDSLTGLYNRRHLEDRLREMFEHSQRLHEPMSCALFDLDHFKSVNDTYGHQVGDEVLIQLAEILKLSAREIDRVGRFGGEEFMTLLPGTVLDAAVTYAERTRVDVERHIFTYEGGTLRRTISCGVAGWPHPRVNHRDHLVKAADDALYIAKRLGRNRVVRFGSPEYEAHSSEAEGAVTDRGAPASVIPEGLPDGVGPKSRMSSATRTSGPHPERA